MVAYRLDLAAMNPPTFPRLEAALIIAEAIGVRVEVLRVQPAAAKPGQPMPLELVAILDAEREAPANGLAILFHHRHFSLPRVAGSGEGAGYVQARPDHLAPVPSERASGNAERYSR